MAVEAATTNPAISPARTALAGTIRQAASATGVNFGYLVAAAKIESNLNPSAAAPSSSARGLYQFIDQTWLGTVKEAGSRFGYGRYADAITRQPSGRYEINNEAMRGEIMQLRKDPAANAAMAGVLTRSNSFKLTGDLGRRPSEGELYIAHFLGAGGATKLISQAEANPQANAAAMFPRAAAANRSIFYDANGNARTAAQVYSELTGRYAVAASSDVTRSMMAAAGVVAPAPGTTLAALSTSTMAQASAPQRVAFSTEMSEAEGRQLGIAERNARFSFHGMFKTGDRAEPISAAVRELWANGSTSSTAGIASDVSKPAAASAQQQPQPLDLFSDRFGTFSG